MMHSQTMMNQARWFGPALAPGKQMLGGLLRRLFVTNSAFWLERDLRASEGAPPPLPKGVCVAWGRFSEVVAWIRKHGSPWMLSARELATARSDRHWFLAVYCDDEMVGYVKIGRRQVYVGDYRRIMRLPERFAFIYDTWIQPEHRGRGIAGAAIEAAAVYLRERGYTGLGCHIPPWNTASLRAYERAKFVKVRYVRHFRLLGLPFNHVRQYPLQSKPPDAKQPAEKVACHGS